jgi:hypothetical protein
LDARLKTAAIQVGDLVAATGTTLTSLFGVGHLALVSEADCIAAQDILAARSPSPECDRGGLQKRRYLIAGLLTWGGGRRMDASHPHRAPRLSASTSPPWRRHFARTGAGFA